MSFARPKGNPQLLKKIINQSKQPSANKQVTPPPPVQESLPKYESPPLNVYQDFAGLYRFKEQVDLCYAKINAEDFIKLYSFTDPPQCLKSALICLHILFDKNINFNQVVNWTHIQQFNNQTQLLQLIGQYEIMAELKRFDQFQLLMAKNQLLKYILVYQKDSQAAQKISKNIAFTLENLVKLSEFLIAYIELHDQVSKHTNEPKISTTPISKQQDGRESKEGKSEENQEKGDKALHKSESQNHSDKKKSPSSPLMEKANTPKKLFSNARLNAQTLKLTNKKTKPVKNSNLNKAQKQYVFEGKVQPKQKHTIHQNTSPIKTKTPLFHPMIVRDPPIQKHNYKQTQTMQSFQTGSDRERYCENRSRTISNNNRQEVDIKFLTQNTHTKYAEIQRSRCATDIVNKQQSTRNGRSKTINADPAKSLSPTLTTKPVDSSPDRHPLDHYIIQRRRMKERENQLSQSQNSKLFSKSMTKSKQHSITHSSADLKSGLKKQISGTEINQNKLKIKNLSVSASVSQAQHRKQESLKGINNVNPISSRGESNHESQQHQTPPSVTRLDTKLESLTEIQQRTQTQPSSSKSQNSARNIPYMREIQTERHPEVPKSNDTAGTPRKSSKTYGKSEIIYSNDGQKSSTLVRPIADDSLPPRSPVKQSPKLSVEVEFKPPEIIEKRGEMQTEKRRSEDATKVKSNPLMQSLTESEINKITSPEQKIEDPQPQLQEADKTNVIDNQEDESRPNPRKCDSFIQDSNQEQDIEQQKPTVLEIKIEKPQIIITPEVPNQSIQNNRITEPSPTIDYHPSPSQTEPVNHHNFGSSYSIQLNSENDIRQPSQTVYIQPTQAEDDTIRKRNVTKVSNKIAQMQQMLNLGNIFGNAAANAAPKKKNEFEETKPSETTEIQMGRVIRNAKRKMRTLGMIATLLEDLN